MTEPTESTWRILDAAANRAREGLRVVEDFARFCRNDALLCRRLKECRHDLTAALTRLPEPERLAARDTRGDVGTTISTPAEFERSSAESVAAAAFKRTQEALRTLEEFSKIVDPAAAALFEQLRYRSYTLEKDLAAATERQTRRARLAEQQVYLLITAANCRCGLEPTVRGALDGGIRILQVREKHMPDRELVQHCRRLRQWTSAADALLIVNDRPDLAVLADADGVHVGQEELSAADARRIVGPDRLVGVSTHDVLQARQAVTDGADCIGVGPTFPSTTKEFAQFPGLQFLGQVASEIALPWFAIGGIDASRLAEVRAAGAARIAVSSAVCQAADPQRAARQLIELMRT